jgi:hypothetical protein
MRASMPTDSLTNNQPSMKLWTWQKRKFDICRDHVKLDESCYYKLANGIPEKYKLVEDKLKTKDIIWCYTVQTDWEANKNKTDVNQRVCWALNVPISKIECFVDDWLANSLLNHQPYVDIATRSSLRKKAIEEHPNSHCRQNEFVDAKVREHLRAHSGSILPPGGWSEFFLKGRMEVDGVVALLHCPVDPHWVIKCPAETICAGGSSCQH